MIDIAEMIQRERADVYNAMAWARLWKQAAKAYRGRFKAMVATLKLANAANDLARDCYELSQATADRRLELLRESVELFYILYNEYVVNEEATLEMIGKIEEELGDAKS